jgi:hypothetical protein
MDEFPRYVIEYLLDNYCEEETFEEDFELVKRRLRENFPRRGSGARPKPWTWGRSSMSWTARGGSAPRASWVRKCLTCLP